MALPALMFSAVPIVSNDPVPIAILLLELAGFLRAGSESGKSAGSIGSILVEPLPVTVVKFIVKPRPGTETLGSDALTALSISTGSVPRGRNSPGDRMLPVGGTQAVSSHVYAVSISPDGGTVPTGII